jgi:hypothetical protein
MSEAKRAGTGDADPLLNVGFGKPLSDSTNNIAAQAIPAISANPPDPFYVPTDIKRPRRTKSIG